MSVPEQVADAMQLVEGCQIDIPVAALQLLPGQGQGAGNRLSNLRNHLCDRRRVGLQVLPGLAGAGWWQAKNGLYALAFLGRMHLECLVAEVRIPVDDLQAVKLLAAESPRQVYHAYLQARLRSGLPDCPVVGTGLAIFFREVAAPFQLVVVVPPVSGRTDSGINRGPDRICAYSRKTAGPAVKTAMPERRKVWQQAGIHPPGEQFRLGSFHCQEQDFTPCHTAHSLSQIHVTLTCPAYRNSIIIPISGGSDATVGR